MAKDATSEFESSWNFIVNSRYVIMNLVYFINKSDFYLNFEELEQEIEMLGLHSMNKNNLMNILFEKEKYQEKLKEDFYLFIDKEILERVLRDKDHISLEKYYSQNRDHVIVS